MAINLNKCVVSIIKKFETKLTTRKDMRNFYVKNSNLTFQGFIEKGLSFQTKA
jgi:hypothetical protein